jgi:L-ascorbate metabolism protein UlaG (beta-lactamase superfamily)
VPEACNSYKPAVTAARCPAGVRHVVIRWLGNANFEFAYKGKVYLFDAYFERTPRAHQVGFTVADVTKAEAIFVSHAHFDHISDIGPVARQTGAPVVGAPITAETAKKLGVPEKQIVVARGGETMKFGDATAEIALAQHSTIQPASPTFTRASTRTIRRLTPRTRRKSWPACGRSGRSTPR